MISIVFFCFCLKNSVIFVCFASPLQKTLHFNHLNESIKTVPWFQRKCIFQQIFFHENICCGTQQKQLDKAFLRSTYNMCFRREMTSNVSKVHRCPHLGYLHITAQRNCSMNLLNFCLIMCIFVSYFKT